MFLLVIPSILNAQYYNRNSYKTKRHEISFGLGPSSCLTDIGGGEATTNSFLGDYSRSFLFDLDIQKTNFSANFSHMYHLKSKIAFRTSFTYAKVSGDDSYSGDFFRRNRALNFNTTVIEGSGMIEITLIPEKTGNKYNLKNKHGKSIGAKSPIGFGVFIFAGFGSFYYNPWGTNKFLDSAGNNIGDGQKWPLRELHSEGQGFDGGPEEFSEQVTGKKYSTYKNFAICIPFGFGIKKAFHNTAGIKFEASYRFTNTDYLDDVSTFYYDRYKLKSEMNKVFRAELSERAYIMSGTHTGEKINANSTYTDPGMERGGPNYNDSYMFLTLSVYKKLTSTPKNMKIANPSSKRKIKASF